MQISKSLINFIDHIKSNPHVVTYDEAATKQAIILPLLQHLGWNTHNIDEVIPEESVENKRVDYSLRVNGIQIFIEVKKVGDDLEDFEKQLLEYCFYRGVDFGILTNGLVWWFYIPTKKVSWNSRKFVSFDLIQQDSLEVAQKLTDLLSKQNMQSAKALKNAESIYSSKMINETLPLAWNKLISQPDLKLIELLAEATEMLCSYKPYDKETEQFLKSYEDRLIISLRQRKSIRKRNKSQTFHNAASVMVTPSIGKLLDGIARDYLVQRKKLSSHEDNITVYSHSDYHFQFMVRQLNSSDSEFNSLSIEQIEIVTTSKELVHAFDIYCTRKSFSNAYRTPAILGARLNLDRKQLAIDGWEIASKKEGNTYFKKINGRRYYKLIKTDKSTIKRRPNKTLL